MALSSHSVRLRKRCEVGTGRNSLAEPFFFLAHSKMIKTPPFYAEIVHSEMGKDGRVRVYIENPDAKDGFHRHIH